jgi:hypothetical protein
MFVDIVVNVVIAPTCHASFQDSASISSCLVVSFFLSQSKYQVKVRKDDLLVGFSLLKMPHRLAPR